MEKKRRKITIYLLWRHEPSYLPGILNFLILLSLTFLLCVKFLLSHSKFNIQWYYLIFKLCHNLPSWQIIQEIFSNLLKYIHSWIYFANFKILYNFGILGFLTLFLILLIKLSKSLLTLTKYIEKQQGWVILELQPEVHVVTSQLKLLYRYLNFNYNFRVTKIRDIIINHIILSSLTKK